ncbi:hypothetical protein BG004_000849, partial [Podila humilis]
FLGCSFSLILLHVRVDPEQKAVTDPWQKVEPLQRTTLLKDKANWLIAAAEAAPVMDMSNMGTQEAQP